MYSSHQYTRLSIMAILGCLPFSVNGAVESMPLVGGVYNSAHVFKHQITNSLSYSTRLTRDTALFTIAGCSGQLKLATVLEFSQYNRSDSLGVKPPLY